MAHPLLVSIWLIKVMTYLQYTPSEVLFHPFQFVTKSRQIEE